MGSNSRPLEDLPIISPSKDLSIISSPASFGRWGSCALNPGKAAGSNVTSNGEIVGPPGRVA